MKQIAEIERRITQHIAAQWAEEITAELNGAEHWWPRRYALGRPDAGDLDAGFGGLIDLVDEWRRWSSERGAQLVEQNVRIAGATHALPSHIVITDLDHAALTAGAGWPERVARGRQTAGIVAGRFPHRSEVLPQTLRSTAGWTDVDIALLCSAAEWFATGSGAGLSPREVPLEGFHSKWLETRIAVVSLLAGVADLGLRPRHPSRVHFTYLDPDYLASGSRRYDSATVGDSFWPAYTPELVIICENKDTAIHFPALHRAISVEGAGSGAAAFATFPWISAAPRVIYWGDMDADGLRILAQFRERFPVKSIFMDVPAYRRWQRFGTDTDKRGNPFTITSASTPQGLEPHEQELWCLLTGREAPGFRRIEQERIPLEEASAILRSL